MEPLSKPQTFEPAGVGGDGGGGVGGGVGGAGPLLQALQFVPQVPPVVRSMHIWWLGQQKSLDLPCQQSEDFWHFSRQHFDPGVGAGGAGVGGDGGDGEGNGVPPPLTPPQPPHVFGQFPFTVDQWQYDLDLLHDQYGARPVLLMPAPDTLSSQVGCFPPVTQTRAT